MQGEVRTLVYPQGPHRLPTTQLNGPMDRDLIAQIIEIETGTENVAYPGVGAAAVAVLAISEIQTHTSQATQQKAGAEMTEPETDPTEMTEDDGMIETVLDITWIVIVIDSILMSVAGSHVPEAAAEVQSETEIGSVFETESLWIGTAIIADNQIQSHSYCFSRQLVSTAAHFQKVRRFSVGWERGRLGIPWRLYGMVLSWRMRA
jgi:hypothetical protein